MGAYPGGAAYTSQNYLLYDRPGARYRIRFLRQFLSGLSETHRLQTVKGSRVSIIVKFVDDLEDSLYERQRKHMLQQVHAPDLRLSAGLPSFYTHRYPEILKFLTRIPHIALDRARRQLLQEHATGHLRRGGA